MLHTQGECGLKRVVKKEHADGSVTQSQFDAVGRLKAQTDAEMCIRDRKRFKSMQRVTITLDDDLLETLDSLSPVSYTHLRHRLTNLYLCCRSLIRS